MNDISKTNIQTKLIKALESEKIATNEAARILGTMPQYISMMKNPATWDKLPITAWESVLTWVNSGQTLKEYSEKHGKVCPEIYQPKDDMVVSREIRKSPMSLEEQLKDFEPRKSMMGNKTENQRIVIDIEINLIINGKKVCIN
jgi:hypothetical protein